jgi:hypothetical protein
MDELLKVIKEIADSGMEQDKALLSLVQAVIDRLMEMENLIAIMQLTSSIQSDTIGKHNKAIDNLEQTLKAYTDKKAH